MLPLKKGVGYPFFGHICCSKFLDSKFGGCKGQPNLFFESLIHLQAGFSVFLLSKDQEMKREHLNTWDTFYNKTDRSGLPAFGGFMIFQADFVAMMQASSVSRSF